MKKVLLVFGVLVLFCLMFSCQKSTPTTPDAPSTPSITPPTQTSVKVTSTNSVIMVGQKEQMSATVKMSDGTTKSVNGTWSSSDDTVATVRPNGLAKGKGAGTAHISCEYGGMSDSKKLRVRELWSRSGRGDNVFTMPTYVTRVRVNATYTGYSSNFIVWVGGRLLVNELVGTGWGQPHFSGTYITTGGTTEIKHSSGVAWSFKQVLTGTATANTTRKLFNIPSQSDPCYREYEIYKRESKSTLHKDF